jgi:type VI secretion system secreted protein VgrG
MDTALRCEPFSLTSDFLPAALDVVRFHGHEALGRSYELSIEVVVSEVEDLDLDAVVGAPATFTLRTGIGDERYFNGIIARAVFAGPLAEATVYRLDLVPKIWRLGLSSHSRVFIEKSVPEILLWVLEQNQIVSPDFELRLSESYEPRPHVSQYRETDLAFISRLMEREGIYCLFESKADREVVVLVDNMRAHVEADPPAFFFRPHASDRIDYSVEAVAQTRQSLPSKVALADYNKLRPALPLRGEALVSKTGSGVVSLYGDNFSTPADGARLARLRAQELAAQGRTFAGTGCLPLRSGRAFRVEGHPRSAYNATFLATQVTHRGERAGAQTDGPNLGEAPATYRCDFIAIPADVQFRLDRSTPVPRIDSVTNAVVDGPIDGDYAQLDEHGRYRVRLKYDENDGAAGGASMWVRMAQPHGGATEGFHFPLRKGTEVLIVFLGGDPDRPIICGVLPNVLKPSPVTAANHTKNVIQTGSANRLEMEDAQGGEYIRWCSPYGNTVLRLGADAGIRDPLLPNPGIAQSTDGDWDSWIGRDIRTKAGRDMWIRVDGSLEKTIAGTTSQRYKSTRHEVTEGWLHQEIGSGFKQDETGFYEQNIHGGHHQTVDGFYDQDLKEGARQTVTGDMLQTVSGHFKQKVGKIDMVSTGHWRDFIFGQHVKTTVAATEENFIGVRLATFVGGDIRVNLSLQKTVNQVNIQLNGLAISTNRLKYDTNDMKFEKTRISIAQVPALKKEVSAVTVQRVRTYLCTSDLTIFN